MKKLFTLFASVLLFASAFAQYSNRGDHGRGREDVYNEDRRNDDWDRKEGRYHFNSRERDQQIAHINRQFDRKIHSVRNRWFTSHAKKQRILWELENERRHEIRKVYAKFSHPSNRYDKHDRRRG